MADLQRLNKILTELAAYHATLIAVSKTKPLSEVKQVYDAGHKIFGENYVQEMKEKQQQMPDDAEWHFIGHLQSNKVKMIAPFVSLIHGVDNERVLEEINRQGEKNNRTINCLLQIYIAKEDTKFGLSFEEAGKILENRSAWSYINIKGFMGMSTNTDDTLQIRKEFSDLHKFYSEMKVTYNLSVLSMGMTNDYKIALDCGSTMVRIGSAIFGDRVKEEL
jgi:pyridoxal phosphate enzyme (YggS family)